MGTRSLVHFVDNFRDKETVLVTVYRQFDGYLEGRGLELGNFLAERQLVNGVPMGGNGDPRTMANGIGCLAAQWIACEKDGTGGVYILAPGANDCWEEYTYWVRDLDGEIEVEAYSNYSGGVDDSEDEPCFKGSSVDFVEYIKAERDSEEEVA